MPTRHELEADARTERELEYAWARLQTQVGFGEDWGHELARLELGFSPVWDRPMLKWSLDFVRDGARRSR